MLTGALPSSSHPHSCFPQRICCRSSLAGLFTQGEKPWPQGLVSLSCEFSPCGPWGQLSLGSCGLHLGRSYCLSAKRGLRYSKEGMAE
jgi:hypothetical protein